MLYFKESYIGVYNSKTQLGGLALVVIIMFLCFVISIDFRSITDKRSGERMVSYEHSLLSIGAIGLFIQILASYAYAYTRLNLYYLQFYMLIFPFSLVQRKMHKIFKQFYPIIRVVLKISIVVLMCKLYFDTMKAYDYEYRFLWQSRIWKGV